MDLSVADGFLHIIKKFLALDVFITQIIGIYIDVFISQRNDIFGWIKEKGGGELWLLHFHIQYEYQMVRVVLWWLLLIDKNWWTKASPEISKCLKCEFLGWGPPPMLKPTVCMGSRQKCNQRYLVIYDSNIITTSESDVLLNFSCLICTTECFGLIFYFILFV